MTKPFITAICVTYGRVRYLENAIADFLAQDYDGKREMVVLNTFPRQNFPCIGSVDSPVIAINLKERPASLGVARNQAIECADGDLLVVFDDDDAYLPHLLSTFAEHWEPGLHWLWLDKRLWAEGSQIKGIVGGCHGGCFAFSKEAWQAVGGYPNMTVGEDRVLVQKITSQFKGKKVNVQGTPPFICRWSQGVYHTSGEGDDTPDRMAAHDRVEAALIRRINSGQEAVGVIELKPQQPIDWPKIAADFMAEESKKKSMNKDVCIVQLGRFGDIINILPIALHIHNQYGKPHMMVSREFASILDGVSYVEPYIVDLANSQLHDALTIANREFKHVIITQIWGKDWQQERLTQAYNVESWRAAGFLNKFQERSAWKPVFDRRDRERERALLNKARGPHTKPMILLAASSVSSPFPKERQSELLARLNEKYGARYLVVDLTPLRSDRIYDILGLIEDASVVITVDTAVLHLTAATDTDLVCITNPHPWLGSVPRGRIMGGGNHGAYQGDYSTLDDAVKAALLPRVEYVGDNKSMQASAPPTRRLIHCTEMHPASSPSEENRRGIAQESWKALYAQNVIECHLHEAVYPRNATGIGDARRLPFLKDVLMHAMSIADPDDIIFWSNDDNFLHPQLPDLLRYWVSLYECCCSQRCEFNNTPLPPASAPPVEFTIQGRLHMGRDIFAFTKRWLEQHWDDIGDFILGASDWDLAMAALIRLQFGIQTTRKNLEEVIFPAEIPRGYVSHSYHPSGWNKPGVTNTSPANMWNRRLFKEWASKHATHLVFDQNGCI